MEKGIIAWKKFKPIILIIILIVTAWHVWSATISSRMITALRTDNEIEIERYLELPWDVNVFVMGPLLESSGRYTSLEMACFYRNYYAVEALLERGADPNRADGDGHLPISQVFSHLYMGNIDEAMKIADLLFEYNVDVANIKNMEGNPLYMFSKASGLFKTDEEKEKYFQGVKYLVEKGARCEKIDVIYNVASNNHFKLVKYIIEDVELGIISGRDEAAVSGAVEAENYEMAEYLLEYGFSATAKVPHGKTPMEYAEENKDEEMVELLKRYID